MSARMPLRDLLAGIAAVPAADDIVVSGLSLDSREARAGDAFVALRGTREHGIAYAPMAVERGAVVVLAEAVSTGPGTRDPGPAFDAGIPIDCNCSM
jgi:UDP-N-acetylmuramoyl-L-alanyl-D-glutamate--2,6-diaminopimelate ligase